MPTLSFLLIWNWNDKFVHTLQWFHRKPSSITDSRQIRAKSIPVFRLKPHPGAAHTYIAYINSSKAGRLQLQLQLYSFTFNLQFHDSFHPRIGEPNRGGGTETHKFKERKEKKNYFTNSTSCRKTRDWSQSGKLWSYVGQQLFCTLEISLLSLFFSKWKNLVL